MSGSKVINRVFTRGVIDDLTQQRSNEVFDCVVRRYIDDPESKTHGQLFSEIYAHLGKEKRNEYYYTNTLLNKLLVGIHSVNTTTALSKIRIGQAIADFIMINGEGKVYEVKSELDNFDRLRSQISNYYKAFSKVSVLVSEREYCRVEQVLTKFGPMGEAVGIYVLNGHNRISQTLRREPQQFDEYFDHTCIFKMLRKREYEKIILSYFKSIPHVAPVYHFRACLEQFQQIPLPKAQELARKELRERNKIKKAVFDEIPEELKSVVYFSELTRKLPALEHMLQTNYRGN